MKRKPKVSAPLRMADVARAAGVSQATASYVLNNKDVPLSPQTRKKVLAAAKRLGYRPNRLAQNLARKRSGMVGAMVEFIDNPYYAEVTAKLNRKLHALGYTILFDVADHDDLSRGRALSDLLSWQPDGLICYWHFDSNKYVPEIVAGCPLVFLGTGSPPPQYNGAFSDVAAGALIAMRHLIELGHRRIVYLGWHQDPRHDMALRACAEAGLPPPLTYSNCTTPQQTYPIVREMLGSGQRPTAIFCHNDAAACGAYRALRDAGLQVPRDVSLVGFDDIWVSKYLEAPLTTVRLPIDMMVDQAVRLLGSQLRGEVEGPQQSYFPPELVVRNSTAPPAKA